MLALPLVKAWDLYPLKVGTRETRGSVSISLIRDLFKSVLFPSTHRVAHVFFFHPFHLSFLTHEISSFPFCPMLDTHSFFFSWMHGGVGSGWAAIPTWDPFQFTKNWESRIGNIRRVSFIETTELADCWVSVKPMPCRICSLSWFFLYFTFYTSFPLQNYCHIYVINIIRDIGLA